MSREKQIEEMAEVIQSTWIPINHGNVTVGDRNIREDDARRLAYDLYNAGYRKQSEGEWIKQEKIRGKASAEAVCSNCGREVVYQVIDNKRAFENFCPHCGAKMKGGAEQ